MARKASTKKAATRKVTTARRPAGPAPARKKVASRPAGVIDAVVRERDKLAKRVQELEAAWKDVEKILGRTIKKTRGATKKQAKKLSRRVDKLVRH